MTTTEKWNTTDARILLDSDLASLSLTLIKASRFVLSMSVRNLMWKLCLSRSSKLLAMSEDFKQISPEVIDHVWDPHGHGEHEHQPLHVECGKGQPRVPQVYLPGHEEDQEGWNLVCSWSWPLESQWPGVVRVDPDLARASLECHRYIFWGIGRD